MGAAWADWRRWIVTLCVAVIALVCVEPAHAESHALGGAGHVFQAHHSAASEGSGQRIPDEQESKPHAHCTGAHIAQMPAVGEVTVLRRAALCLGFAYEPSLAVHGLIFGLERPPRATAKS